MATVKDIAKRAGVTPTTVSAVLNRRYVATRPKAVARAERIRRLADQLGYRPNTAAQAVVRGRFQRIGLILPHGRSSYMPYGFMSNLTHALAERDYQLAVSELPAPDSADELPHLLRDLSVDGTINLLGAPAPELRQHLAGLNLPMVWVNEKLPRDCVYPDEVDAGCRLAEYLLSLGHRRVAFVDLVNHWRWVHGPTDYVDRPHAPQPRRAVEQPQRDPQVPHYSIGDRREGYIQAMRCAGHPPQAWLIEGASTMEQLAQLGRLLRGEDRPSALILSREQLAPVVMPVIAAAGLAVPDDLSVASFTWGGSSSLARLGFTCIVHGADWLSQQACEVLKQRMDRPDCEAPARTVIGRLLIDRSTAPHDGKRPAQRGD